MKQASALIGHSSVTRCLVAVIFAICAIWSWIRYADIGQAGHLARIDNPQTGRILAVAAPDHASALWLDAYSERLAGVESTGARLRALDAARRAARIDPDLTQVWNRIAWLNISIFGRLTSEAENALNNSFALVPFGPVELIFWRIRLADMVWQDLPDSLRARFVSQIEALRVDAYHRRWMRDQAGRCSNADLAELLRHAGKPPGD